MDETGGMLLYEASVNHCIEQMPRLTVGDSQYSDLVLVLFLLFDKETGDTNGYLSYSKQSEPFVVPRLQRAKCPKQAVHCKV
jgi:hypothetical protein